MRILTPKEVEKIGGVHDIPIELTSLYFPVSLQAFKVKRGEETKYAGKELRKIVERVLRLACMYLDAEPLQYEKLARGDTGRYDYLKEFYWNEIEKDSRAPLQQHAITQAFMFSSKRLLFGEELKKHDIKARPGFLYFSVLVELPRYHNQYLSGAVILEEMDYREYEEYRDTVEWQYRDACSVAMRSGKTKKEKKELVDAIPVPEVKEWYGPILDIAHITNSRIVKKDFSQRKRSYILETPLEFPPGFVRETAYELKKECGEDDVHVQKFMDCVFHSGDSDEFFSGPDKAWLKSEAPFFVQRLLLARLMGGDMWYYALGHLEQQSA